jgi:hypothetical protein
VGERFGQRLQRHLGDALALGPVEVAADDDARALVRQFLQGGHEALDARPVRNLTVAHRHVEIGTHQNPLSGGLELIQRPESGHI